MTSNSEFIRLITEYYLSLGFKWIVIAAILACGTWLIARRRIEGRKAVVLAGVISYAFVIISYTVLARSGEGVYVYETDLFWTYRMIAQGDTGFIMEALLNVMMLAPLGVMIPMIIDNWKLTVGVGFLFSAFIEIMQLVTTRGMYETDDIFHNTLGVIIGYCIYKLINKKRKEA